MSNILLLEMNEITWSLIDRFERQGKLPVFSWLRREGAWGAPESVELPPNMDPWITWTTVYTGRPQQEHNVHFLQQPSDTIRARRIWEICDQHGLRVGGRTVSPGGRRRRSGTPTSITNAPPGSRCAAALRKTATCPACVVTFMIVL